MRIPYFRPVSRKGGKYGILVRGVDCHFGRFYEMPFRREYILSDAVVFHPAATVRVLRRKRRQKSAPANVNATGKAIHIPAGPPWNVKPSR